MERVANMLNAIANYVRGNISQAELLLSIRHECEKMESGK